MRILLIHAWLTGNLGDLLQTYVLIKHLKDYSSVKIDIAGYPRKPAESSDLITSLVDNVFYDEPAAEKFPIIGRRWQQIWKSMRKKSRAQLFAKYDLIISAPGPFLTTYDERINTALLDMNVAIDLGIPFVSNSLFTLNPSKYEVHTNAFRKLPGPSRPGKFA